MAIIFSLCFQRSFLGVKTECEVYQPILVDLRVRSCFEVLNYGVFILRFSFETDLGMRLDWVVKELNRALMDYQVVNLCMCFNCDVRIKQTSFSKLYYRSQRLFNFAISAVHFCDVTLGYMMNT